MGIRHQLGQFAERLRILRHLSLAGWTHVLEVCGRDKEGIHSLGTVGRTDLLVTITVHTATMVMARTETMSAFGGHQYVLRKRPLSDSVVTPADHCSGWNGCPIYHRRPSLRGASPFLRWRLFPCATTTTKGHATSLISPLDGRQSISIVPRGNSLLPAAWHNLSHGPIRTSTSSIHGHDRTAACLPATRRCDEGSCQPDLHSRPTCRQCG